jgi:hypothetical protein
MAADPRDSMFVMPNHEKQSSKQKAEHLETYDSSSLSEEEDLHEEIRKMIPKPVSRKPQSTSMTRKPRMVSDNELLHENRTSLRKFEALNIGGKTLTEMSSGGYTMDMEKLAEKAMEVLPLPPSKLPVIFVDKDLNFYHHFFQAMTRELEPGLLEQIVTAREHYDDPSKPLLSCLEEIILAGYERSDDEMTILLKKAIGSTFETTTRSKKHQGSDELEVAANLYGFEYIEQGMKCSEADLRMWLSMCYAHYKTIWFNTFKSTGVPSFATQGAIKHRFSSSSGSSLMSVKEESRSYMNDDDDSRSVSRPSRRRSSASVAGSERRRKSTQSSQLANWLAAKPSR